MNVKIISDKKVLVIVTDNFGRSTVCQRRLKSGRFTFGGMIYAVDPAGNIVPVIRIRELSF